MWVSSWMLLMLAAAPAPAAVDFSTLVGEVRAADYRGDREALQRLATALGKAEEPGLAAYRAYWQGFALWRRAINGMNEARPGDGRAEELQSAMAHFRNALAVRPGWVEAKVGIVGCSGNLLFLLRDADPAARQTILAESIPLLKELEAQATNNPRALWLVGGTRFAAPPPYGGDAKRAIAVLRQGVAAAVAESRAQADRPPWEPSWGGPENLMSLAYVHAHATPPDRNLAEAYAYGALTAVPEWRYVHDVLLPQIAPEAQLRP
jgi:hypothetical protein